MSDSLQNVETILASGEHLVISEIHPPLGARAASVGCWDVVRDDLLAGAFARQLFTPYFVAEIDGAIVGSMSYYAPAESRDVGVVEFVHTAEAYRRKGIASRLLRTLLARFERDGGMALYLCTVNPHAGQLYENCGFRCSVGDGMRWLAEGAGDFDRTYLAHSGAASVRRAHWGDLPGATVLFCHPEPAWQIKEYLTHCFRDTRFEGHFMRLMRRVEEDRGGIHVLENPRRRIVGCVVVERQPTFHQQHVAQLSVRVAPAYRGQTTELLHAAAEAARSIGISLLQTYVADTDDDEKQTLVAAGFAEEAVLPARLRTENGLAAVSVFGLHLPELAPQRQQHEYYGERQPWQTARATAPEGGSEI